MDVWLLAAQLLVSGAIAPAEAIAPLAEDAARTETAAAVDCAVPLADAPDCLAPAPSMETLVSGEAAFGDPPDTRVVPTMGSAMANWPRPSQLVGPRRPAPASPSEPRSGALRPVSGPQLYAFRQASVEAGEIYPQASPQRYLSRWQQSIEPPTHDQWQALLAAEAAAVAQTQGSRSLTVLVGDSLALWLPLNEDPAQQIWLNQSISGETTAHMRRRLHYFAATQPRAIHLMGGINDLKQGVPEAEVVDTMAHMLAQLNRQHPQARLVVYSILPTRLGDLPSDRIQRVNRQLAAVAAQQGATFIDLHPAFSDGAGQLRPELTTDGLHLSPQGYTLWRAALVSH